MAASLLNRVVSLQDNTTTAGLTNIKTTLSDSLIVFLRLCIEPGLKRPSQHAMLTSTPRRPPQAPVTGHMDAEAHSSQERINEVGGNWKFCYQRLSGLMNKAERLAVFRRIESSHLQAELAQLRPELALLQPPTLESLSRETWELHQFSTPGRPIDFSWVVNLEPFIEKERNSAPGAELKLLKICTKFDQYSKL